MFVYSENVKNRAHTAYLTLFGGLQKPPLWQFSGVCKQYSACRHRSACRFGNSQATMPALQQDAARSMSCPRVQMKSPSLFPSPDPCRHRRCAKLYNYFRFNKCDFISTTYCTYRLRALPFHFSKHCGNGKKWQVAMSLSHRHLVVVVLPQPMDLLPRLD